jgi:hypothetical protein
VIKPAHPSKLLIKKNILFSLLVLLCSTLNLLAQSERVAPKIAAIHAHLFYETDGTFSRDMLAEKGLSLWNTIIGEGWAGKPSKSTLFTVEVHGKNVKSNSVKLEIIAQGEKNQVISKIVTDISIYDENSRSFTGLWLNNTGCEKIKITAQLIGGPKAKPTVATIPFSCGE